MAEELKPPHEKIDSQRPVKRTRYEVDVGLSFRNPLSIEVKAGISITKDRRKENVKPPR